MNCAYCGSTSVYLKRKGASQIGLYCQSSECGKWQKWVGKKDLPQLQHQGYHVYNEFDNVKMVTNTNKHHYEEYQEDTLPEDFGESAGFGHVDNSTAMRHLNNTYENQMQTQSLNHLHEEQFGNLGARETSATTIDNTPHVHIQAPCDYCSGAPIACEGGIEVSVNRSNKLLCVMRTATGGLITASPISYCPSCGSSL